MNSRNDLRSLGYWPVGLILLWATAAVALPLTDEEFGASHVLSPFEPLATVNGFENQFTDTYVNTTQVRMILGEMPGFVTIADDIEVTTFMNARVDSTGRVLEGALAVIGSSASLGIATGTALVTATVTDAYFATAPGPNTGLFQFRARVDFLSPALRAVTGPIKSLLFSDLTNDFGPGSFTENPWNVSYFGAGGPDAGPRIDMSPNALPLTPTEALATGVAFNTAAPLSGYDAASDTYTITSATRAFPLNEYPGFSALVGDLQSSFDLSAIVDDTGTLSSGSMLMQGSSVALGIPAGSTLIAGTPVEAYYRSTTGDLFQFLVMVDALHPALEAVIGPIQTIVVYDFQSPGPDFFDTPWQVSFVDGAYTTGPDVFLSPESMMPSDSDGDGIADATDNCTAISNGAQRDTDGDGIGNRCDADLSQDCVVNVVDLGLMRSAFFGNDPTADLNGDGDVNAADLGIMKSQFFRNFQLENPSSAANACQ